MDGMMSPTVINILAELLTRAVPALEVLFLAGHWRLFEKAGEPGWKSLIPGYNLYTLVKIAWGRSWQMWLSLAIPLAAAALCGVAVAALTGGFAGLLALYDPREPLALLFFTIPVLVIAFFVITLVTLAFVRVVLPVLLAPTAVTLARRFGRDDLPFALGMVFLYPVFAAVLAFGDAQYQPPAPRRQRPQPWERVPGGAAADHQQEDTAP